MKIKLYFCILIVAILSPVSGDLIGHWGFEEGSGNQALDSSGNALNGYISNAVYTTGRVGNYALDFNGSNSFVEIAHQNKLSPATIGISLWFKARAGQQTYADILDKGHGWNSTPYYSGYVFQYVEDSSDLGFGYGDGANFSGPGIMNNAKDDVWHHIVINLGQDELSSYVDGVLLSKSDGNGPIAENNQNLFFGRHQVGARYFNGLIDEVRIFDDVLGQNEVNALYAGVALTGLIPEPASFLLLLFTVPLIFIYRKK